MATNFAGYLLRATGAGNSASAKKFLNKYIDAGSWECTPDQREEIKAYRDDNTRNLTRVTAAGTKSTISFETRENLHLADKQAFLDYFYDNESDHLQRKIHLEFWNDETNNYDEGDFYRPNMPFKIKKITDNDIIYDSLKLEFVEY